MTIFDMLPEVFAMDCYGGFSPFSRDPFSTLERRTSSEAKRTLL